MLEHENRFWSLLCYCEGEVTVLTSVPFDDILLSVIELSSGTFYQLCLMYAAYSHNV